MSGILRFSTIVAAVALLVAAAVMVVIVGMDRGSSGGDVAHASDPGAGDEVVAVEAAAGLTTKAIDLPAVQAHCRSQTDDHYDDCVTVHEVLDALAGDCTDCQSLSYFVSTTTGRVVELVLMRKGLKGHIPAAIGRLEMLEELWLYTNELTGTIPAEMGDLSNLTWLFVSSNELSGQIPENLNNLTLDRLWLHNNDFTGCVPYNLTLTREYKVDSGLSACAAPAGDGTPTPAPTAPAGTPTPTPTAPAGTPTPSPTAGPGNADDRLSAVEGRLGDVEKRVASLETTVAGLTGSTPTPTPTRDRGDRPCLAVHLIGEGVGSMESSKPGASAIAAIVVIALLGAAGAGCSPSGTAMASDPTPTAMPAEPTTRPAEPTAAPAEPTAAPAEPTAAPTAPTTRPAEPTTTPAEPTTTPAEPTTTPAEPTTTPAEPTTTPAEPTAAPTATTATPADPTAAPTAPTTTPADPTAAPTAPTTTPAEPTAAPTAPTTTARLRLPTLPDKSPSQPSPADRTTATAEDGSPAQGPVYTWQDGDRTMRVVLQTDLVVQKTETNEPGDVLVVRMGAHSIVQKKAGRGTDAGPVFRSESGGGLMTLPGGILLALDPEWDRDAVEGFFSRNGISTDRTSELGFLANGFLVETEPGFPSLELANALAAQDGVLSASPNWWREMEAR